MYLGLVGAFTAGANDKQEILDLGEPYVKDFSYFFDTHKRFRSTTAKSQCLVSCKATYKGVPYDVSDYTSLVQVANYRMRIDIDFTEVYDAYAVLNGGDEADLFLAGCKIRCVIKTMNSLSGISCKECIVVSMDDREDGQTAQDAIYSASHTFFHEIGHYVGLSGKFLPDRNNTINPNFYSEKDGEESARLRGGVGVGPHCDGMYDNCVMYHFFKPTLEFCDTCKLFMRARALHNPIVNARDVL